MSDDRFGAPIRQQSQELSQERGDVTSTTISVWGTQRESELVNKTRTMISEGGSQAYAAIARLWSLVERVAQGEVDALNDEYSEGIPVLECEIGWLNREPWFAYVAQAKSHAHLLLISKGHDRKEARRRCLIWIGEYPSINEKDQIVIINIAGEMLEERDTVEMEAKYILPQEERFEDINETAEVELTVEDWNEAERQAAEQLATINLDTPEHHLSYIREKIKTVGRRNV